MSREYRIANFAGRPVALLGDNALFAVIKRQDKLRVLVGNDTSGEGAMFIDEALADGRLRVIQQVESQHPIELCRVHQGNLKYMDREYESALFIAKVLANETDDLRICYSGHNDPVPSIVATGDDSCYNLLDAGSVFHLSRYNRRVNALLTDETVRRALPATWMAKRQASLALTEKLAAIRQDYIRRFVRKEIAVLFISLFKVEENVLSYGGIRIVVNDKLEETLLGLADLVTAFSADPLREERRVAAFEFEQLLPVIVKRSGNVEVDGVALHYEKKDNAAGSAVLHYLNDRKIAVADLHEVINRVTCYRRQPELYGQFLQQVSAVSLKFHRASARGIPISGSAVSRLVEATNKQNDEGLPHDYRGLESANGVSVADVCLPFRKVGANSRGEVFLLDEWRKVENFDLLCEVCLGCMPHRRRDRIHCGNDATGAALRLLGYIDRSLEASCRTAPQLNSAGFGVTFSKEAMAHAKEFLRQFKIDASKRQEALKRSRELFLRVIEQEKVRSVGEPPDEYWLVTGKSGRSYRVNRDGKVHRNGKEHVCIVNGGGRDLGGWDYLSSLIIALANDTLVAGGVNTLKL